ncbi:MAG: hypothetical protein KDB37_15070 [Ilumatobacter sp.]|nr:hypothetical protein [Ilumatobacter sp.]
MSDRTVLTSARLAREWQRMARRPALLRRADTWHLTTGPLRDLNELVTAVGGGGDRSPAADARLRELVLIARHDDLAARVVIERLVPGLLAGARRLHRPAAFEELLAAAWIAIRTYNPARRNSVVAASLIGDAEWLAFRRHDRRRAAGEIPTIHLDRAAPAHDPDPDPKAELADLLDEARAAGVPDDDLALVDLLLRSPSVEEVAAELEVTTRTVRNRRARVAAKLRDVALAA